ncbi:unnamed protein product [Rhizophagus irregularis]|nr:unnamed protein product [Rhizophagus irregularis]
MKPDFKDTGLDTNWTLSLDYKEGNSIRKFLTFWSALGLESGISSLALVLGHADMASDSFGENFDKPTICNSARKRKSATVKPKKSNKINNQSIPHR